MMSIFNDPIFDSFFNIYDNESAKVIKTDNGYTAYVTAPGFKKDEIDIEVNGTLKVSGEIKDEEMIKKIGKKSFAYKTILKGIDKDSVKATLADGILSIDFSLQKELAPAKILIE